VSDVKVCPLMSTPNGVVTCKNEQCAWWYGGRCAVHSIADDLRDIERNIK
jgi:hypothetical protein